MAAKIENLKPVTQRTKAEAREIGRKGGIASGEARRKKNTIKSILKQWADSPITIEKYKKEAQKYGIETDEGRSLLTLALIKQAMNGNQKYMDHVMSLLNEDSANNEQIDDGFNAALKGTAAEDWKESDDV